MRVQRKVSTRLVVLETRKKCDSFNRLVLLIEVDTGVLSKNGRVLIKGPGGASDDKVLRIEKDRHEIEQANSGDYIGICLKNSSAADLEKIGIHVGQPPEKIYCP